ncbi:MAG: hypothetical protein Q9218_007605 [Villophora microphyllina]
MEVVGGVASLTQLVAYSHVVAKRLVQLHKVVQEGPQLYRTQRSHISFLLDSIQRICISEAPDTETILPLLISTAHLAHSLLNLLQQQGALYHLRLWASKGDEIETTFRALKDKACLLQLHITERTYNIVANVQKDIMSAMNQSKGVDTSKELQPKQEAGHLELKANGNKADGEGGIQRVANGWGTGTGATSWKVEASENEKKGTSGQFIAEHGEILPYSKNDNNSQQLDARRADTDEGL